MHKAKRTPRHKKKLSRCAFCPVHNSQWKFTLAYEIYSRLEMSAITVLQCTVILQIFGVVLFSVLSVIKKTPKCEKNTLSDNDSIHGYRNLNYTERSAIARHRNFNAPKICKITVSPLYLDLSALSTWYTLYTIRTCWCAKQQHMYRKCTDVPLC